MSSEPPEDPLRFPPTRWSVIEGAQSGDEVHRLIALERFLHAYYEPLKTYLRFQFRLDEDEVRDYAHDFILNRVILRNLIARADQSRGKFRTFVIQSLNRFMIDELRKQKAAKRNPGEPLASLDALKEESLCELSEAAQSRFDIEFARHVVQQTLIRMRERCEETSRQDLWNVFHERVLGKAMEGRAPLPYDKLTELLGVESHAQAANLLTSAKRMFVRVFKSVIKDYEADDKGIESEIGELRYILSNS